MILCPALFAQAAGPISEHDRGDAQTRDGSGVPEVGSGGEGNLFLQRERIQQVGDHRGASSMVGARLRLEMGWVGMIAAAVTTNPMVTPVRRCAPMTIRDTAAAIAHTTPAYSAGRANRAVVVENQARSGAR